MEVPTPWGSLVATPVSLALGVAVFAGWYLTLEQAERVDRRALSIAYAAAWLGAGTELLILRSVGAPSGVWPVTATLAAVVSVGLATRGGGLAKRLDTLAPALGMTFCLMLVVSPSMALLTACAVAIAAVVLRPSTSGQRFLVTCLALVTLWHAK